MTGFKNISINDALTLIENEDIIILDVRAPWEFNEGHIKNAENLDFTDPDFKDNIDKLNKNKKYVVYCKTGRRGAMASEAMIEAGFSQVYNLIGGYNGWKQD
jgi:rhodanese-related sulfurtransferase